MQNNRENEEGLGEREEIERRSLTNFSLVYHREPKLTERTPQRFAWEFIVSSIK